MKTFAGVLLLCAVSTASAQTASSLREMQRGTGVRGASAANPWIGAQVMLKLPGTDEASDALLVTAMFLHEIPLGSSRFHLPIGTNIGDLSIDASDDASAVDQVSEEIQQLLLKTGLSIGIYPYYQVFSGKYFRGLIHGEGSLKMNSVHSETENDNVYVPNYRAGVGVEFGIGADDKPRSTAIISVTPMWTFFDGQRFHDAFGEDRSKIFGVELTGILPIGKGFGVLLETILADRKDSNVFRGAILLGT